MTGQQCVDRVHPSGTAGIVNAAEAVNDDDDRAVGNEMHAGVRNVHLVNVKLRRSHSMKVVLLPPLVNNTSLLFMHHTTLDHL